MFNTGSHNACCARIAKCAVPKIFLKTPNIQNTYAESICLIPATTSAFNLMFTTAVFNLMFTTAVFNLILDLGGYELFSALYPFLRTQKIIYTQLVSQGKVMNN